MTNKEEALEKIHIDRDYTYTPKEFNNTCCKYCGISSFPHSHKKGSKPNEFIRPENSAPLESNWEEEYEKLFVRVIALDSKDAESAQALQDMYDFAEQKHKKVIKSFISKVREEAYQEARNDFTKKLNSGKAMYEIGVREGKEITVRDLLEIFKDGADLDNKEWAIYAMVRGRVKKYAQSNNISIESNESETK